MPAMPATLVAAALAVVIFKNLRRGILVMVSSHRFVTDVTHDRLTGVGSNGRSPNNNWKYAGVSLVFAEPLEYGGRVLQSARPDGRQPFCFSVVLSHLFKSAFIGEAVVMVHEAFDHLPTTSTGCSGRRATTCGYST